ncbi:hypothetical protein IWX80_002266 [Flavobacterium sp. CAN_S2]
MGKVCKYPCRIYKKVVCTKVWINLIIKKKYFAKASYIADSYKIKSDIGGCVKFLFNYSNLLETLKIYSLNIFQ